MPKPRQTRDISGFTILEVVMALLVVAAVAVVIIPKQFSNRIVANEDQAVLVLRRIAAAQERFKAANEGKSYALLDELMGLDLGRRGIEVRPDVSGLEFVNSLPGARGYHFLVYLADEDGQGVFLPERLDASQQGRFWVAYAWPTAYGISGRHLFAVNARGDVFAYENSVDTFSGQDRLPPANLLGGNLGTHPLEEPAAWVHKLPWRPIQR